MSRDRLASKVYFAVQIKTVYDGPEWTDWVPLSESVGLPAGVHPYKLGAEDAGQWLKAEYRWVTDYRVVKVWEQRFLEGGKDD